MRLSAAVLSLVLAPVLLTAAFAAPDVKPDAPSPVEKVRKDLNRPLTIKIDKQPLSAAIDQLRDRSKINIVLDGTTIQQQLGFAPDQPPVPVDVDLKDAPVRSVLRSVLDPYGLTYIIIGDTVIVTTGEMAMMRQLRQRISVDMDKVELAVALQRIAHDAGVNVLVDGRVDKDAKAKISLQLEDVPLDTAVRLLAESANLKPVRVGNVLFVTSREIANEMRQDPDLSQPQPALPILTDK